MEVDDLKEVEIPHYCEYDFLHSHVRIWVETGKLQFKGFLSGNLIDDLDRILLPAFGIELDESHFYGTLRKFACLRQDFRWMQSDHGPALFLAKCAQFGIKSIKVGSSL
jgi:hypothetical protein